jgi:maltooligosyltrehalose trehalohydrolase
MFPPLGPEDKSDVDRNERWRPGRELVSSDAKAGTLYKFQLEDGGMQVPDPASRYQPMDVHGPSEVVDPGNFIWTDAAWHGRLWEECVIYELDIGTFTSPGTFQAVERLDWLVALGITAIEIMPVADFPGKRNWGYDGVLLFAPDSSYGRPEENEPLCFGGAQRFKFKGENPEATP